MDHGVAQHSVLLSHPWSLSLLSSPTALHTTLVLSLILYSTAMSPTNRLWQSVNDRLQGARRVKKAATTCTPQLVPAGVQLTTTARLAAGGAGGAFLHTFSSAPVLALAPAAQSMERAGARGRGAAGAPGPRPGGPRQQQAGSSGGGGAPPCWTQLTGAQLDGVMRGTAALHLEAHKAREAVRLKAAAAADAERRRAAAGPGTEVAAALAQRRAAAAGADGGLAAGEKERLLAAAKEKQAAAAAAVQDPSQDFIEAYYGRMEEELEEATKGLEGGADDALWGGFGEEGGEDGGSLCGGSGRDGDEEEEDDDGELPAWA
jgi:hypothetical protein